MYFSNDLVGRRRRKSIKVSEKGLKLTGTRAGAATIACAPGIPGGGIGGGIGGIPPPILPAIVIFRVARKEVE